MKICDSCARMDKFIEERAIGIVKFFIDNPKRIFQVCKRARTDNGRSDAGLVFDPKQGQL